MESFVSNALKQAKEYGLDDVQVGVANIKVVGCGGGGSNTVTWLHKKGIQGAEVVETVQEKGFDGILVTRLIQEKTGTPSLESYAATEQPARFNLFQKGYDVYYYNLQHPKYIESESSDRRVIDVWVINNEQRMIWSATSKSPERNSVEAVQNDITDLVMPELARNAIIKSRK